MSVAVVTHEDGQGYVVRSERNPGAPGAVPHPAIAGLLRLIDTEEAGATSDGTPISAVYRREPNHADKE